MSRTQTEISFINLAIVSKTTQCFIFKSNVIHVSARTVLLFLYIYASISCKPESIYRSTGIHTLGEFTQSGARKVRNRKPPGFCFRVSVCIFLLFSLTALVITDSGCVRSFRPKWFSRLSLFYSCTFTTHAATPRSKVTRGGS